MRITSNTPSMIPLDPQKPDPEISKSVDQTPLPREEPLVSERTSTAKAGMMAEQRFGGLAQEALIRSQLDDYERLLPDRSGANKASGPSDLLVNGSNGAEVKELQHNLNEWRMQNGQPPIAEDGSFRKGTEDALKEYQTAMGLNPDGIAGPNTKTMLKLESDPNFKQLNTESKREVATYLAKYKDNPVARENVIKLATDPAFAQASPESRSLALTKLSEDPTNANQRENVRSTLADIVKLEQSSTFEDLLPSTRSLARNAMMQHCNLPEGREGIAELISNENFQDLSEDLKDKMIGALAQHPSRFGAAQMQNVLNAKGYPAFDGEMRKQIVGMASSYADDPKKLENLSLLLDDRAFVMAEKESQELALTKLSENPVDASHREQVLQALGDTNKLETSKDFQNLSPHGKSLAHAAMMEHSNFAEGREDIAGLISNENFQDLSEDLKNQMIGALAQHPSRFGAAQMQNILNAKGYPPVDRHMQSKIIDIANQCARDPNKLSDLSLLLDDPEFVNASKEEQNIQLNRFSGRTGLEIKPDPLGI